MSQITIIIPVHNNRHNHLTRILAYYANSGKKIIVGDSSPEKYTKNIDYDNVSYFHFSQDIHIRKKLLLCSLKINTPYSVICAVDDFIIPDAMDQSVVFLNNNPNYSSAQGNIISFFLKYNRLVSYPQFIYSCGMDLNMRKPSHRIMQFFSNKPCIVYSVRKSEHLQKMLGLHNENSKNIFLSDFIFEATGLVFGYHKTLPIFYSVREYSSQSTGSTITSIEELVSNPEFKKEIEFFIEILSGLLITYEDIEIKFSKIFFNEVLYQYIKFQRELIRSEQKKFDSLTKIDSFKIEINKYSLGKFLFKLYEKWIGTVRLNSYYKNWVRGIPGFPYEEQKYKKQFEEIKEIIFRFPI